jgi:hypothetical protein
LEDFLLELPAVPHQMAGRFVLRRRHVNNVHAVALAAQPGAEVDGKFDGVEPVGLCAPLVAFDGDARGIDDITFDPASLQGPADPERVLAVMTVETSANPKTRFRLMCRLCRASDARYRATCRRVNRFQRSGSCPIWSSGASPQKQTGKHQNFRPRSAGWRSTIKHIPDESVAAHMGVSLE